MPMIPALVNAASSLVGSVSQAFTNASNRRFEAEEAQKQRDWNEAMAEKQNAWNYEQWLRETEYNSPTEQVKRMRDAGLNPLYYGLDGNSAAASPTAVQPLGYSRASLGSVANPFAVGLDSAAKVAQVSNIQADTAKKNNENLSETVHRELNLVQIENARQSLENLSAQKDLTDAQRSEIQKRLEWIDRLNAATIAEKESSISLNESQKKRIDELLSGEKALQDASLSDFEKRWKKIEAETKLLAEQWNLTHEDVLNYALNHSSNGFLGTGLSFQNFGTLGIPPPFLFRFFFKLDFLSCILSLFSYSPRTKCAPLT